MNTQSSIQKSPSTALLLLLPSPDSRNVRLVVTNESS